jgi:anti-sigma B factor antagonist
MADEFAVTEQATADDRYVVAVRGTVNLFSSAQLLGKLLQAIDAGHDRLVVDLCDTTFMDSSGMSALLSARKRMARHPHGRIVIACASEDLMRAFEIAELPQLLRFEPTRQAALDALGEPATDT